MFSSETSIFRNEIQIPWDSQRNNEKCGPKIVKRASQEEIKEGKKIGKTKFWLRIRLVDKFWPWVG